VSLRLIVSAPFQRPFLHRASRTGSLVNKFAVIDSFFPPGNSFLCNLPTPKRCTAHYKWVLGRVSVHFSPGSYYSRWLGYQDSRFKLLASAHGYTQEPESISPSTIYNLQCTYFRVADLAPFKSPLKRPMHEKPSQYRISSSPGMYGASVTNPIPRYPTEQRS
jgi:hypothetical protein